MSQHHQILTIPKPKGISHIFWEHALKSVLGFTGMFALLFFGPLFLGSKSRNSNNQLIGDYMAYLTSHPMFSVTVSIGAVVVYNLYIIWKNTRAKYVVGITLNETNFTFAITTLYYTQPILLEIPKEHVSIVIERKIAENSEKTVAVKFVNSNTTGLIGMIKPHYSIWENHLLAVKYALAELRELGVPSDKRKG